MSLSRNVVSFASFAALATIALGSGCSSKSNPNSDFNDNKPDDTTPYDETIDGGDSDGGNIPSLGGLGEAGRGCVNLECNRAACSAGVTTTVSGTVYDPAGKVPLYNVIVYVPNAPLEPFKNGATCDQCGIVASGSPIATALTDSKGHFKLENVPVGKDVPLVMQVGKWRRQIKVPSVTACKDTPITDHDLTRLPRNQKEGDIPQMALTTGGCDGLECLFRKMGIDDSEFTPGTGKGRMHLYKGDGGASMTGISAAEPFWSDVAQLKKYDMVLLSCECSTHSEHKPAKALTAMHDYAGAGGRVFGTHYHYYWFQSGPPDFKGTATWDPDGFNGGSSPFTVDQSTPKGKAFADWLVNVGASTTKGQIELTEVSDDVNAINTSTTQQWIYSPSPQSAKYMTFNAPVSAPVAQQCGRVVYSDLHVSGTGGGTFPTSCETGDLTAQEKALEFLFFDLSACVQDPSAPPPEPPVK
jgi:hypothetical protein